VALNLQRFQTTLAFAVLAFFIDALHGAFARKMPFIRELPLIMLILLLLATLAWLFRSGEALGRRYYVSAEVCLGVMALLAMAYELNSLQYGQHFLLTCLLFNIFTQLSGIRLSVILVLCGGCFLAATAAICL
jgi:hypothetical protein